MEGPVKASRKNDLFICTFQYKFALRAYFEHHANPTVHCTIVACLDLLHHQKVCMSISDKRPSLF